MHGYNRLSRTKCSEARYAIWVIDSSLRLQHNSYNQQSIKLWCLFIQFPKATSYLSLQDLPCVDYVRMQKRQLRLSAGRGWGSFLAHWQYLHIRPMCAVRCDHRLPHCLRKSKVIKELPFTYENPKSHSRIWNWSKELMKNQRPPSQWTSFD